MAASSRRSSAPILHSLSPNGRFHSSHRSTSPTRLNLYSSPPTSPSVRFSLDRPISPSRSISVNQKRTCMCSPTTHKGSFRCGLHKNSSESSAPCRSNRLNDRRSAMTNSLVRIGTVEGEIVKRALAALIRPSSHNQRRRVGFQQRPSRLSIMSKE